MNTIYMKFKKNMYFEAALLCVSLGCFLYLTST